MRARQVLFGLLATAASALPAAAQSVYVYPRYYGPPAYYAPPPAYVYRPPARYYAPPATYAPYAPPPPVEYDYPHRTYPHAPERTQRDSGAVAPTYQPPLVAPDFQQPLVVAIQQELSARGYDPGPATGAVDARTASAIRRYQQDVGLPVTGQASQGLLDHMRFSAAASPPAYGSPGYSPPPAYAPPPAPAVRSDATVAWVQDALNRRGYNVGPPDGILGQRTRQGIERFKRDNGLPVDALINELLIERLRT